ncbi:hypothetical protein [Tateyamaria sp. SN3-11]|uniref:hypothetical protein n=1 Tax=Tateyamaria sp. SN3-11 TaxID=3092147 RepID=UPI0039ED7BB4
MLTKNRLLPPMALVVFSAACLAVILTSRTLAIDGQTPLMFLSHKVGLVACKNVDLFCFQTVVPSVVG